MRFVPARMIAIATAGALGACAAAALPATASTAAPAVHYTFRKLDNASDPTFNRLLAINKTGVIAGYFGSGAHGHGNRGYLLQPPYGQSNYIAENFPNAAQTQVTGLNDRGVTVGFFSRTNRVNPLANANFGFYRKNGRYHKVAFSGTSSSPAINQLLGVNNSGVAVGFYLDAVGNSHGYRYNIGTGKFTVLKVSSAAVSVTPTGINNKGDVTGYFNGATGNIKSFLVTHAGHLYILNASGAGMTQAFGVNDSDEVVGATTVGAETFGFTWTPGGGFHAVSDPNGVGSTIINGVNDSGQLVGFYNSANGDTNGMLATP